jgi:hypothetical protein
MVFLPRRFRIACFCILTPFQVGIILTANYTFLNYLVLFLGFLLLDDAFCQRFLPARFRSFVDSEIPAAGDGEVPIAAGIGIAWLATIRNRLKPVRMAIAGALLGLVFYSSAAGMIWMFFPFFPLPDEPMRFLGPFRVADRYGLFAVMTHERYEIEFQGSTDGKTWTPYPFRYKPQDLSKPPGIYAPYQPRFEWNLWFASLGSWRQYRFVLWTEERLLRNQPQVLQLFASNPFPGSPPVEVRAVIYQYWFTDMKTKREKRLWWRRESLGEYAPALAREPDGKIRVLEDQSLNLPQP